MGGACSSGNKTPYDTTHMAAIPAKSFRLALPRRKTPKKKKLPPTLPARTQTRNAVHLCRPCRCLLAKKRESYFRWKMIPVDRCNFSQVRTVSHLHMATTYFDLIFIFYSSSHSHQLLAISSLAAEPSFPLHQSSCSFRCPPPAFSHPSTPSP
jgi:hypothetical protein